MRRVAGSCRFVFNKALALQKARYEHGEKKLGYAGLCKLLTQWRNNADTAWLAMPRLSAAGIPGLQGGEDVNGSRNVIGDAAARWTASAKRSGAVPAGAMVVPPWFERCAMSAYCSAAPIWQASAKPAL
jgi:hypothetical protein